MSLVIILVITSILFIISNGVGKLILNSDSKIYNLRSIIGFMAIMAILQIGYYPMQVFRLSSLYVHIYTILIIGPSLIYGIMKIKKEDFFFLKSWEFYLLLFMVFGLIKIIPANEAGDDWFYMPLIKENAFTSGINMINPKTGWDWQIDNLYQFQGYYLFMSFIYRIVDFMISGIDTIFISFRSIMSLLFIIFSSIIIKYTNCLLKIKKDTIISIFIKILAILLLGVLEWSHIYWGSFAIFPIFIPLYIIILREYVLSHNKKYLLYGAIINFGMLSLVSSALFLNSFITFSFMMYSLYKKEFKIKDYFYIIIPIIIYITFFIGLPYLSIILVPLYYFFKNEKISNKIDNLFNRKMFNVLLFLPLIFFITSIIFKHSFSWNIYRLGYTILMFNLVMCLGIGYLIYKKQKIDPILFMFLIFNIFFFNPLTGPFISNFLTTSVVYYRLFYVTKNPLIIIIVMFSIYNYIKDNKILKVIFIIGLIGLIGRYTQIIAQNTFLQTTYKNDYDYTLREDEDSKKLGQYLETIKEDNIKIISMYFSPRQYNNKYFTLTYRYPNDPKYKNDLIHQVLYQEKDITNNQYIEFKNYLTKTKYNYIIIYNNNKIVDRIKPLINIVYKNDTYILCRVEV